MTAPELFSESAERGILGACLTGGSMAALVMARLHGDDFYFLRHQHIYDAICNLERNGVAVDVITVSERLKQSGKLAAIADGQYDGIQVLSNLIAGVYRMDDVETWCDIVRYHALRRRVAEAGDTLRGMALKGEAGSHDLIAAIDKTAHDLRANLPGKRVTFGERLGEHLQETERLMNDPGALRGVPTGFKDLDRITYGWQNGTLNIIAGRPGMGKTTFALNAMLAAARAKLRVGFFSLEMSNNQLKARLLSSMAGVNVGRILAGRMNIEEYARYQKEATNLNNIQDYFYEDYQSGYTPSYLRSVAYQWQLEGGLDVIFIDYITKMTGGPEFSKSNRNAEVGYIARMLADLAKELDIPIVALSQLSRNVEQRADKRPLLSDLRESGEIEQEAYTVSFLYRHSEYDPTADRHHAELIVAKNRNGKTGTINLHYDGQYMRFSDGELRRVELGA